MRGSTYRAATRPVPGTGIRSGEDHGLMIVRLDDKTDILGVGGRTAGARSKITTLRPVVDMPDTVVVTRLESEPVDGATLATAVSDDQDSNRRSRPRRSGNGNWLMAMADFISLSVALVAGLALLAEVSAQPANSLQLFGKNFLDDLSFPFVTLLALAIYGLYQQSNRRFRKESFGDLGRIGHAMAVGGFLTLGAGVLIHRIDGASEIHPAQLLFDCSGRPDRSPDRTRRSRVGSASHRRATGTAYSSSAAG